jgi:HAD superfamily hydrolase (TIGR01509 family)
MIARTKARIDWTFVDTSGFTRLEKTMAQIKAVFFDQDGVIIDTERDGHRVSFNMTFKEFGFTDEWSVEYYHELLQIAGGKERMKHHAQTRGFSKPIPPDELDELVKAMHKRKTALFVELIETGKLPLRPGIHRFMKEAMAAGIKIGVCTTSNEQAAKAITEKILTDIKFELVLAGDVVQNKKPDPEIYNLALSKLGLKPEEVMVVEDSRNGVTPKRKTWKRATLSSPASAIPMVKKRRCARAASRTSRVLST